MKPAFTDKCHNCSTAVLGRRQCFPYVSRPHVVPQKQHKNSQVRLQRVTVPPVCATRSELAYATGAYLYLHIYSNLSRGCRHQDGIEGPMSPQRALPKRMLQNRSREPRR